MKELQQQALSKINENLKEDERFLSYQEMINSLNANLQEHADRLGDVQEAYDLLDEEYDNNLSQFFVFYSSDGPWGVTYDSDDVSEERKNEILDSIRTYYSVELEDLDAATSFLEHRVSKDMSNIGCDPNTALSSILSEVDGEELFKIFGFDGPYKLELFNF